MHDFLRAPVYRAILFPALIFGMPRRLFLVIGIATLALVLSLGQIWFLAVTLILIILARRVAKEDRYVFEVYMQLFKLPKVLD
jgi:type IV secretory pathway VirB3-like protein